MSNAEGPEKPSYEDLALAVGLLVAYVNTLTAPSGGLTPRTDHPAYYQPAFRISNQLRHWQTWRWEKAYEGKQ